MDVDLLQDLRSRRTLPSTKQRTDLVACSLCLRVRRGSEWREAEQVIRELRSYELEAPPRLHSAVCEVCAESIFSRRVAEEIRVEAA
jgi:NMD protein affecting ribosome stability and mRNA decay